MIPSRRWLVLGALMLVTLACEAQWLVHAAVARPAAAFYIGQFDAASLFNIDALALMYMVVFLVLALPASAVLDRWGLGVGVGVGAVLTLLGAGLKAGLAASFAAQLGGQLLLAAAQPFLINASTTLAREWFPAQERATAAGLATLAQYLGFVAAMVVAPLMVQADPALPGYGAGFEGLLWAFGGFSAVGALVALAVVRRGPLRSTKAEAVAVLPGLRALFANRDFRLTFGLFLIGLGILNAVSSLTDSVAAGLGVRDSDGLLGVGLIGGGIVGAVLLPLASDLSRRRKLFLVAGTAGSALALLAPVLAPGNYLLAVVALAFLGFCLLGAGPVGFQYAAETTAPVPEALSQGVLLWAGQASGLVLTALLSAGGPAGILGGLATSAGLMGLVFVGTLLLAESPAVKKP